MAADARYPVTGGGAGGRDTGRRTLTVLLAFPIGSRAGGVPPPPGVPAGSPGITSAMFVAVAPGALEATRSVRWKLARWWGRSRGMTRQRRRWSRRSLWVARTNVIPRGMRSQTHQLWAVTLPRLATVIR